MNNDLTGLINIVREKAKIEEVIADYVQITRKGNSYQGLCPFHADQSPSMSVSPDKGIFKCFSCGAGGNVISFVQNHEGISFIEAIKKLSEKYEIKWRDFITERKVKPVDPEIKAIREVNQEALNFYKYQLENELRDPNAEITKYLKSRKINKKEIDTFNLGFSTSGNTLVNFLLKKGFDEAILVKAGLAKATDNGLRDYFINRLLFSLADEEGNVIGFSGRQLTNDKNMPKYLNTAETPAFKKGTFLYNFHRARSPISLKKKIIVVEGYMDVISFSKMDINNVVATMGTAFTTHMANIVTRATNSVTLAMDGDVAGINATISSGKSLFESGMHDIKVFMHTKTKDIDELVNGYEKFVVQETLDSSVVTFEEFYKMLIITQPKANFEAIREFLRVLSKKGDAMESSMHINQIANKYDISATAMMTQYNDFLKNVKKQSKSVTAEFKTDNKLRQHISNPFDSQPPHDPELEAMLARDRAQYAEERAEQKFIPENPNLANDKIRNDELDLISYASVNGGIWRAFVAGGYSFVSEEAKEISWALKKYFQSTKVVEKNLDKILDNINIYKETATKYLVNEYYKLDLVDIKKIIKELKQKCLETQADINNKIIKETSKSMTMEDRMAMLKSKQIKN